MTLIGILGALMLERLLSHWRYWRTHDLTGHWLTWLRQRSPSAWFWQSPWGLPLLLLPPLLAVWAAFHYLALPLGPLGELALGVVILLACLGPRDMSEEIHAYIDALETDNHAAADEIRRDLMAGPKRSNGDTEGRSVVRAAFVQGHERWFGVLVWFFVLGPLGALFYRLSASVPAQLRTLSVGGELLPAADVWHGFTAWPTARATALCYALAGSTDHARSAWQAWRESHSGPWATDAWPLLARVGEGSLAVEEAAGEPQCLRATLAVLNRALMVLLAVFAFFTLGGWLA